MAEAITETASPPVKSEPKAKVNLTDRLLKSLKPGERPFEVMDSQVRALGIRVMPSGVKTFILRRRYPGSTQPARRSLGTYGEMSLAQARDKAREWNASVKKGIDPALEEYRRRQATIEAERQRQASTFGAAFEAYLERKASKLKSGPDIEREMRRECKSWMALPLADISPATVKAAIQA
ncbi:MAG: Arm DNA-binding domain-containing protein, partial [Rhodomicrobium sp.]